MCYCTPCAKALVANQRQWWPLTHSRCSKSRPADGKAGSAAAAAPWVPRKEQLSKLTDQTCNELRQELNKCERAERGMNLQGEIPAKLPGTQTGAGNWTLCSTKFSQKEKRENIDFLPGAKKWTKLHLLMEKSGLSLLVLSYPYRVALGKAVYV